MPAAPLPAQIGITSLGYPRYNPQTGEEEYCKGYSLVTSVAFHRAWIDFQLRELGY